MNNHSDPVILFCTTCHSAYIRPAENAASFTVCLQCQSALGTIERGLNIRLRPGGGNTGSFNAMDDPFEGAAESDYAFSNEATNLLTKAMPGDGENTDPFGHLPKSVDAPRARHGHASARPQFTEVIDLPSDIQAMAQATARGAAYDTGPMDAVTPNASWNRTGHTSPMGVVPMHANASPAAVQKTDEYEAPATVDFGRITPEMLEQERKAREQIAKQDGVSGEQSKTTFIVVFGCLFIVLMSIAIALIVGIFILDLGPKNKEKKAPKPKKESSRTPLEQRPLHQRLEITARAFSPQQRVLSLALPTNPANGEAVLLTDTALWFNESTLSCVSMYRVCEEARPFSASPWVPLLARRLEHRFQDTFSGPIDTELAQRWVIVLVSRETPSRALYETLYTSWERGARLQVATQEPRSTTTFNALEMIPLNWPEPSLTGAPSDLVPQAPTTASDTTRTILTLHIRPDGLTLLPPGQSKPIELLRRHAAYPVSDLLRVATTQRKRHGNISAVHVHAQPDTSAYTLLRSIGALIAPIQGLPEIAEVRFASPAYPT